MNKPTKPTPLQRLQMLNPFVRERLEVLAESDLADELLAADEARRLERRAALIAVMQTAPAKHEAARADAANAARKAEADHAKALRAAAAALQAMQTARGASIAAEHSFTTELAGAERELIETADRRLGDGLFWILDQADQLRMKVDATPVHSKQVGESAGTVTWVSNAAQVNRARERMADCASRLRTAQLQAIAAVDVDKLLVAVFADAEAALVPYELRPPTLEDREVKRPRPWHASTAAAREDGRNA